MRSLRFGWSAAGVLAAGLVVAAGCAPGSAAGGGGAAQPEQARRVEMSKTVTVGEAPYTGTTNAAIQKAVDDVAAAGGGTVIVPAGTYAMDDALHLRSHVRVVGRPGAVLKKVPSVSSAVDLVLGFGFQEFRVKEPDKFRVGMGVHVHDDNAGGFYDTVATIVGRKGDLFYIDRAFAHDYVPSAKARVTSVFALVQGIGVHDAAVEGLTIDGNYPQETVSLNGCRGGGLFLMQSQRMAVKDVEIANYHGDALSFQQCADVWVEDCRLHHNTGHGLHPGSGSVRYVFRRVKSHHNGNCGLYYCLRTTHSLVEDCDLSENGENGISVGERDSDHLIRRNRIVANAKSAIGFRGVRTQGGDRVIIRDNTIGPNCTKGGPAEIAVPKGLQDVIIEGNAITVGAKPALSVEPPCTNICFYDNRVSGPEPAGGYVSAPGVRQAAPARLPAVGPAALPLDGARHLGLPPLPPWPASE